MMVGAGLPIAPPGSSAGPRGQQMQLSVSFSARQRMPMLVAALLVAAILPVARAQDLPADQDPSQVVTDPAVSLLMACSCDCCQTVERSPDEWITYTTGKVAKHKCDRPMGSNEDTCPNTCSLSNADQTLTSAFAAVDAKRFCLYKCKPVMSSVGVGCQRLTMNEMETSVTTNGNGREFLPLTVEDSAVWDDTGRAGPAAANAGEDKSDWEKEAEEEVKVAEKAAVEAVKEKQAGQEITYDYRKLTAERLRAEAGAAMARGASSGERIRLDQHTVDQTNVHMAQLVEALGPVMPIIQQTVGLVEANKSAAVEASAMVAKSFNEAKFLSKTVFATVKAETEAGIKTSAQAAATEEAKAYVTLQGWDKPEKWGRILAMRQAQPYMQAVSAGVQRADEYERYAKGLIGQAEGAQSTAAKLTTQANAMKAVGDQIQYAVEMKNVNDLLAKSRSLQAEAQGFWKTANDAQQSVPQWTAAAAKVVAYTGWRYAQSHPNKPPV